MAATLPRVTTIVPVFNGARYLADTIRSVLAQTWGPIAVLVVDDGSSDESAAVASAFGEPVRVVRQPHGGQVAALNHGLRLARTDLVAFLDADDLWDREKVARQVARFDARSALAYCVTRVRNFLSPDLERPGTVPAEGLLRDAPGFVVSTLMARRAVFDRVGVFDGSLRHANKTDWFLRARALGLVEELLDEVLVHRRLHEANTSQVHARRSVDEYLQLVKRSLDRARQAPSS